MASIEMQQSGEPLAEAMGRDLAGFDRFGVPRPLRRPGRRRGASVIDLVELLHRRRVLRCSKMPMNSSPSRSTAGTSLAHAPCSSTPPA